MRYTTLTFAIPASTSACLLSTSQWSSWARAGDQFRRGAHRPHAPTMVPGLGTTARAVGDYVMERIDTTDSPQVFNYNAYAHIQTSVGHLLGPARPTTFIRHRSSAASTWFAVLRTRSDYRAVQLAAAPDRISRFARNAAGERQ